MLHSKQHILPLFRNSEGFSSIFSMNFRSFSQSRRHFILAPKWKRGFVLECFESKHYGCMIMPSIRFCCCKGPADKFPSIARTNFIIPQLFKAVVVAWTLTILTTPEDTDFFWSWVAYLHVKVANKNHTTQIL